MGLRKKILILGYGEMGHAMEFLLSAKHDVSVWSRSSRAILENEVAAAHIIIFCLAVNAHDEMIGRIAPYMEKDSLCLTIAKGLDESGRTAAQVFANTLSVQKRYGVLYGPMISEEILLGRFAFADVALLIPTDYPIIQNLFQGSKLVCRDAADIQGCSWSVILKNVYAIMFGICDGLKLGDNVRGHLMVTALSELSTLVKAFGGDAVTPLGYAGLGDLMTTATSFNSHHHELGRSLAAGNSSHLTGEGIHTLQMIEKYQLLDYSGYPLYSLIWNIVKTPDRLAELLGLYIERLQRID